MLQNSVQPEVSDKGDGFSAMNTPSKTYPTVMIVEDDDDSRLMMKVLLEMKGYKVLEAASGEDAIAAAEAEPPGLILMDLQLPRLSGFAVTRYVRQHARLRETPIIIISGHDPVQHRQLALAAGCNEFLHKPIDFGLLEKTLGRLLPVVEDR